jgi:membrane-associated phospholipid phosphatase
VPRLVHNVGTRLPHGWRDLLRQIAFFLVAYNCYQLVRGIADGRHHVAFANAIHVMHLERSLGAFFEPGFQQAFLNHQWVIDIANWMYFNSHFVITTSFLVWLYLFRNENFNFVRNMFMVAMGLALVGYALFPTAPPRLAGVGIADTVSGATSVNLTSRFISSFYNPYAAVPSMHIGFALLVGFTVWRLARRRVVRVAGLVYPAFVLFVIVATGNHFFLDAAAGAAVAAVAALLTGLSLRRRRPIPAVVRSLAVPAGETIPERRAA